MAQAAPSGAGWLPFVGTATAPPSTQARPLPDRDAARPAPREHRASGVQRVWHRLALAAILALSTVLELVGLGSQGYPNQYYAAAVLSMLQSWRNFFFV